MFFEAGKKFLKESGNIEDQIQKKEEKILLENRNKDKDNDTDEPKSKGCC